MCAVAAQPHVGLTPMIPTPSFEPGIATTLEPEDLVDEDDGNSAGGDLPVDDQDLVDRAVNAIRLLGASILEPPGVLVDPLKALFEVRHDLLRPDHENDAARTVGVRAELASTHRGGQQRPGLGDGMDAPEHHGRGCGQAADVIRLGLAGHAPDPRPEGALATGLLDLFRDASRVERLRRAVMDLRSIRNETHDDSFRFRGVGGPKHRYSVGLEGGRGAGHPRLVRDSAETADDLSIKLGLEFGDHWLFSFGLVP